MQKNFYEIYVVQNVFFISNSNAYLVSLIYFNFHELILVTGIIINFSQNLMF